jgi:hypothetical protein
VSRIPNHWTKTTWLALPTIITLAGPAMAAPRAFPEAEGFGALATGGRGNPVVHVTTLADSGAGSLREAISQGNRIVVFDVGGVINLASKLVAAGDNLTIAGQTAPGSGITVYGDGTSFSSRKNIVVRFVRFHQGLAKGSAEGTKAVNCTDVQNMIFDHISVLWGRWDGFGITGDSSTVTLQDSIVGEGVLPQKFGSIVDSADKITIARNLWIDNESRNPKFKANGQYINNVVYNWGSGGGLIGGHSSADWFEDVINNYLIAGPTDTTGFLSQYADTDCVYHKGNMVDVDRDGKLGGRAVANADFQGDSPPTFETAAHNNPSVPVTLLTAQAAYDHILTQAGACQTRDAVDQRLITQLRSLGTAGAILGGDNGEAAVGGQPTATMSQRPAGFDSDGDGMPDTWETAHGLNPASAADAITDSTGDGYTNVEKYLNELAASACGGSPPPDGGTSLPVDAAPILDSARLDASDTINRDAGAAPDSGTALSRDAVTADVPATDTASIPAPLDTAPPDAATLRDAASPADLRPVADPDASVPGPDSAPISTSPDVGTKSPLDAEAVAKAKAGGCTCNTGAPNGSSGLAWLFVGLFLLARRWRRVRLPK